MIEDILFATLILVCFVGFLVFIWIYPNKYIQLIRKIYGEESLFASMYTSTGMIWMLRICGILGVLITLTIFVRILVGSPFPI